MAKIADEYEELINNATPNEIAAARENCCVGCRAPDLFCDSVCYSVFVDSLMEMRDLETDHIS
jgi:hypothetical protein